MPVRRRTLIPASSTPPSGQPAQDSAEHQQEQDSGPEHGHGDPDQHEDHRAGVQCGMGMLGPSARRSGVPGRSRTASAARLNSMVTGSAWPISQMTGCRVRIEWPKSPCDHAREETEVLNVERLVEAKLVPEALESPGRSPSHPSRSCATSPGIRCMPRKTRRLTPRSTGSICTRRRATYFHIVGVDECPSRYGRVAEMSSRYPRPAAPLPSRPGWRAPAHDAVPEAPGPPPEPTIPGCTGHQHHHYSSDTCSMWKNIWSGLSWKPFTLARVARTWFVWLMKIQAASSCRIWFARS